MNKITLGILLAFSLGQSFASEQDSLLNKSKYDPSLISIMDKLEETYKKEPIPPGDKVTYFTVYKDSNGEFVDFTLKQLARQKFTDEDRTPESINEIKEDLTNLAIKNCKSVIKIFIEKEFSIDFLSKINFVSEQTLASGDQFLTNYKCNVDSTAVVNVKYLRINMDK